MSLLPVVPVRVSPTPAARTHRQPDGSPPPGGQVSAGRKGKGGGVQTGCAQIAPRPRPSGALAAHAGIKPPAPPPPLRAAGKGGGRAGQRYLFCRVPAAVCGFDTGMQNQAQSLAASAPLRRPPHPVVGQAPGGGGGVRSQSAPRSLSAQALNLRSDLNAFEPASGGVAIGAPAPSSSPEPVRSTYTHQKADAPDAFAHVIRVRSADILRTRPSVPEPFVAGVFERNAVATGVVPPKSATDQNKIAGAATPPERPPSWRSPTHGIFHTMRQRIVSRRAYDFSVPENRSSQESHSSTAAGELGASDAASAKSVPHPSTAKTGAGDLHLSQSHPAVSPKASKPAAGVFGMVRRRVGSANAGTVAPRPDVRQKRPSKTRAGNDIASDHVRTNGPASTRSSANAAAWDSQSKQRKPEESPGAQITGARAGESDDDSRPAALTEAPGSSQFLSVRKLRRRVKSSFELGIFRKPHGRDTQQFLIDAGSSPRELYGGDAVGDVCPGGLKTLSAGGPGAHPGTSGRRRLSRSVSDVAALDATNANTSERCQEDSPCLDVKDAPHGPQNGGKRVVGGRFGAKLVRKTHVSRSVGELRWRTRSASGLRFPLAGRLPDAAPSESGPGWPSAALEADKPADSSNAQRPRPGPGAPQMPTRRRQLTCRSEAQLKAFSNLPSASLGELTRSHGGSSISDPNLLGSETALTVSGAVSKTSLDSTGGQPWNADGSDAELRYGAGPGFPAPDRGLWTRLKPFETINAKLSSLVQRMKSPEQDSAFEKTSIAASYSDAQSGLPFPTGEYQGPTVKVRLMNNDHIVSLAIHWDAKEAIRAIVADLGIADPGTGTDLDVTLSDPARYKLCKLDQNAPAHRKFFADGMPLFLYRLQDGDRLRLVDTKAPEVVKIALPSGRPALDLPCEHGLQAGVVVRRLQEHARLSPDEKYRLYYPQYGVWLDNSEPMSAYEIGREHAVELRELRREFCVKVNVPDCQATITLKALPSFTADALISMVKAQISTRRLMPESRESSIFNLWIPTSGLWMKRTHLLNRYFGDEVQTIPDVDYRIQYEVLTVESAHLPPRPVMCASNTTVDDVQMALSVDDPRMIEEPMRLFSKAGEQLAKSELVWKIIREMPLNDTVDLRPLPDRVSVETSMDPNVTVEMDVDSSQRVATVLRRICHRFGLKPEEVAGIRCAQHDGSCYLPQEKTLGELGIAGGSALVAHVIDKPPPFLDGSVWHRDPEKPRGLIFATEITAGHPSATDGNARPPPAENAAPPPSPGHKPPEREVRYADLVAGELTELVRLLTDSRGSGSIEYLDYVKTFLLTYESFTTSANLLRMLVERFHVPRNRNITFAEFETIRNTIQLRVCNVILQWTKKYNSDLVGGRSGPAVLDDVIRFSETVLAQDHTSMAKQVRKHALKLKYGKQERVTVKHRTPPPVPKLSPRPLASIIENDAEEIARQLTIIEYEIFSRIMLSEIVDQAWMRNDGADAPNVTRITAQFNRLAFWTAQCILEVPTVRARAYRMAKLIRVAKYLYRLNNFSTLMSIVAGLNKAPIARLKHTLKEIDIKSERLLSEMEAVLNAEGSYKKYRERIHSLNPPCIPYVGVALLDLTYIHEGNPDRIDGLINFSKRRLLATVIRDLQQYQDIPYNLCPVEEIALQLTNLPIPTDAMEKQLYEQSLQREPRPADRNHPA